MGDTSVSVEFGDAISPDLNGRVIALNRAIGSSEVPGIIETVPTYRSLLVCYDPDELSYPRLVDALRSLIRGLRHTSVEGGVLWTLPVLYGGQYGEDLEDVAQRCGLSISEVIEAHTSVDYLVYFLGFAPGNPIMGRLPDTLQLPRRAQPRPLLPVGSVLIAAQQAGVLSLAVPSGWHVLGRTPMKLFRPGQSRPFLLSAGDRIRFRPIDAETYNRLDADEAELDRLVLGDAE